MDINRFLKIDKQTHRYYLDGISVSQIVDLAYPFDYSSIPVEILDKSILKGNCVHKQMEDDDYKCNHDILTHTSNIEWMKAVRDDISTQIQSVNVEVEKSLVWIDEANDVLITGTIDYINDDYIIDWKTSSMVKQHLDKYKFQLYLYYLIANQGKHIKKHQNLMIVDYSKKHLYKFTIDDLKEQYSKLYQKTITKYTNELLLEE